jgi:hypothetical protein
VVLLLLLLLLRSLLLRLLLGGARLCAPAGHQGSRSSLELLGRLGI